MYVKYVAHLAKIPRAAIKPLVAGDDVLILIERAHAPAFRVAIDRVYRWE